MDNDLIQSGPMRGGLVGTSVQDSESQEGALNLSRANLTSSTLLDELIMFVTALYKVCYLDIMLHMR